MTGGARDGAGPRVLICDPAAFVRGLIREVVLKAGYEVAGEATSGAEAVDRYRSLRPDVVTMEIVLREMGGIEATRRIVAMDPTARVVMCSAMGEEALLAEAREAGAREFIVKPFSPSRVIEAMHRALG